MEASLHVTERINTLPKPTGRYTFIGMPDDTRTRLIDSAYRLFVLKGFGSTRVDEICQAAEASKGSFYHSFKSKEAIGLAVFDRYFEMVWSRLVSGPFVTDPNHERRLKGFLNHCKTLLPSLARDGSLLTNLATELPTYSEDFANHIREKTDLVIEHLAETFDGLDLPEGIESTNELACIFLSMFEGAITVTGLSQNENIFENVMDAFRTLVLSERR